MRIVLDTNVLISAFIGRGRCHDLLEHCSQEHRLVTSRFILDEYRDKLCTKFRIAPDLASEAVEVLSGRMEIVDAIPLPQRASRDPDDDAVIATAVTGSCACIVTGDRDLLELDGYRGIRILQPGEFSEFEQGRDLEKR